MRTHLVRASFVCLLLSAASRDPLAAQETVGSAATGGPGLKPRIVARLSADSLRTYGTTDKTALSLQASTFSPNDSTTTWTYSALNGGQYITGGHPFLMHSVELPEGAQVISMELDGCDNDTGGSIQAWFSKCGVGGVTCSDLEGVGTQTVDTPGCGRFPVTFVSPVTIDNFNNAYEVYFSTSGGSNAAVIAIRLYYKLVVSPAPATATFGDVPTTNLYFRGIEALAASGITGGCGGGNFCPDQFVTRGELAKFLANALGLHHAP